jgi:branched-chain amino acid transport system ATP-binding protein
MSTPLLEVAGLRSGYGAVEILRGVDLVVNPGEIVALLGSNGAGKSTFNNTLCGIVPARAGTIRFDGQPLAGTHYRAIVQAGLIQVPEGRRVFPNLSVLENLELGSFARARERRAQNLERVFGIFPRLKERLSQLAGTMSGGEQQMVAVARAMVSGPRLLLLDEPSLGLAPRMVDELLAIARRIANAGTTVLMVEQNVKKALAVADRGHVLERGVIVASGPADELARSDVVRHAYLGAGAAH